MDSKVFLVTGASSGIGKATCELLNQEGYIVYGVARRIEKMKDLGLRGVRVRSVDVTQELQIVALVEEIIQTHGKIDGLINNAGTNIYGSLEETPISEAKALFDLNVYAYARLIQLVLPYMRAKRAGYIINVGSLAGLAVVPTLGWYCASKFALEALTDSLRIEVNTLGIKVVLIEPYVIKTDIGNRGLRSLGQLNLIKDYDWITSTWKRIVPKSMQEGRSPAIVAKTILKVLNQENPKSRYFIPSYSKYIAFIKTILPDRLVDWLTLLIFSYLGRDYKK